VAVGENDLEDVCSGPYIAPRLMQVQPNGCTEVYLDMKLHSLVRMIDFYDAILMAPNIPTHHPVNSKLYRLPYVNQLIYS